MGDGGAQRRHCGHDGRPAVTVAVAIRSIGDAVIAELQRLQ